eukprot:3363179-Amphidinium_carterae.1
MEKFDPWIAFFDITLCGFLFCDRLSDDGSGSWDCPVKGVRPDADAAEYRDAGVLYFEGKASLGWQPPQSFFRPSSSFSQI